MRVDIPARPLPEALSELSREAGVSIGAEGTLPARRTPAVRGTMSVEAALARMLAGTGYAARKVGPTAWRIERAQRPAPATARPSPPETATGAVDDVPIIVTGSKRPTALLDLPIAVSAVQVGPDAPVPGSTLSGTSAVASQVEGLTVTSLGSGRNRIFLRGVADSPFNGASQATVAVVLDDARLTYAAPDPDIALVDIERVEVLKGPQGALYGTGALGGIYHLVSRRAELDGNSLELASGGEFVAHGAFGYSGQAVANVALVPGVLGLRLVGYDRQQPGWFDTGGRSDSNSQRLTGGRLGIGVDAGGGWRVDLTGFAQWRDADDSQYDYAPGARTRPAQLPEPHDNDLRHLSARLAREGGGIELVLSSGITWHEVGDTYDATIGAESFGLADPQTLEAERRYRVWDNEVRLSGSAGAIDWLVGASAVQARQHDAWTLASGIAAMPLDDDRRKTTDLALFGDATIPLSDTLSLDAGARLFRSTVTDERTVASVTQLRNLGRTGLTPSLALSWRPDGSRLAFVRYGSAIRQGGLSTNASGEPGPVEGDELATLEAGWRQQLPGGGRLDLGAYFTGWENLQSDMLLANGLLAVRNAGKAQVKGLEASLALPLDGDWEMALGAAVQQARLVRNELGIELDDRRLPTVPDYVVRAEIGRSFGVAGADASLRFKLRYIGPARLTFDPQTDRPMGDYLESAIDLRIAFDGFELAGTLDNLFGQHGDEFPFGNPLRFATMRQYTPQRPTSLSLGVRASF